MNTKQFKKCRDDYTAYLAYADWLEEQGNLEEATKVREQGELFKKIQDYILMITKANVSPLKGAYDGYKIREFLDKLPTLELRPGLYLKIGWLGKGSINFDLRPTLGGYHTYVHVRRSLLHKETYLGWKAVEVLSYLKTKSPLQS